MKPSNVCPKLVVDKGQYNFVDSTWKTISSRWFDYAEEFSDGFAKVKIENVWNSIYRAWNNLAGRCWHYSETRSYHLSRALVIYYKTLEQILFILFSVGILIIFFGPPYLLLHSMWYEFPGEGATDYILIGVTVLYWYVLSKFHSYSQENMYLVDAQWKIVNKRGFRYLWDFNQKWLVKVWKEFGLPFNKRLYSYIDGEGHGLGMWFKEGQDPTIESEESEALRLKNATRSRRYDHSNQVGQVKISPLPESEGPTEIPRTEEEIHEYFKQDTEEKLSMQIGFTTFYLIKIAPNDDENTRRFGSGSIDNIVGKYGLIKSQRYVSDYYLFDTRAEAIDFIIENKQ